MDLQVHEWCKIKKSTLPNANMLCITNMTNVTSGQYLQSTCRNGCPPNMSSFPYKGKKKGAPADS